MKLLALTDDPSTADNMNIVLRANLKGVIRWSSPVTVYCAAVGSAVNVAHDLGAVPNVFHVEPYIDSRYWADQDDRAVWTKTSINFHASHTGRYTVRVGVQ